MLDWEGHHKALQQRNKGETRAEQLAGDDVAFFSGLYDQNGQKLKDLAQAVLLDMRYNLKFEYEKETLVRLGIDQFINAMLACSNSVKNSRKRKVKP